MLNGGFGSFFLGCKKCKTLVKNWKHILMFVIVFSKKKYFQKFYKVFFFWVLNQHGSENIFSWVITYPPIPQTPGNSCPSGSCCQGDGAGCWGTSRAPRPALSPGNSPSLHAWPRTASTCCLRIYWKRKIINIKLVLNFAVCLLKKFYNLFQGVILYDIKVLYVFIYKNNLPPIQRFNGVKTLDLAN